MPGSTRDACEAKVEAATEALSLRWSCVLWRDRMLWLIVYLLVVFGIVYVVTESAVFVRVRLFVATLLGPFWETFIYCAHCTGFWVGAAVMVVFLRPWVDGSLWSAVYVFFGGCLTLGTISVFRAVWPRFLPGAHERERDIIEQLRAEKRADRQDRRG